MTQHRVSSTAKSRIARSQPASSNLEGSGGSVANTRRREFSARTKRAAWERANGFCEGYQDWDAALKWGATLRCNFPIDIGGFHYDHIDPDWFSKDNELGNCQVLCEQCHREKSKRDLKNIAKSKRIIDKRIKAKKSKRPFKGWRRFDGSPVYAAKR